jgi:hypothetical protein
MVSQKALDFLLFGKKVKIFIFRGKHSNTFEKNTLKDDVDTICIIIFRQIIIDTCSE